MTIDGIWTSEIYGIYGWESTGILIMENGRVLGGGNRHFSKGVCEVADNKVKVTLDVQYHHGHTRTIFGEAGEKFQVTFSGEWEDNVISGYEGRPDHPSVSITARLTKCSEIPA